MPSNHFLIEHKAPTFSEYLELRNTVGWRLAQHEFDGCFLKRAFYCVAIRDKLSRKLEAFASTQLIHHDFFLLYDLIVRPTRQRQGLGTYIIGSILAHCQQYVNQHTKPSMELRVSVAFGRESFYAKFGLKPVPIQPHGQNEMRLWLSRNGGP